MFGQKFKARVIAIWEEAVTNEDARNSYIEKEMARATPEKPVSPYEIQQQAMKMATQIRTKAQFMVMDGEGEWVGEMVIDITERTNSIFIGNESPISWQ